MMIFQINKSLSLCKIFGGEKIINVNQTYFGGCEIKSTPNFYYTVFKLTNIKDSLKSVNYIS